MREALSLGTSLFVVLISLFSLQCGNSTPQSQSTANTTPTTPTTSTAPPANPETTSNSPLPTPPASAKVFDNIEETTDNWHACSDCAGGGSTTRNFSTQLQSSPAMNGLSRQFHNGGTAWSNVLWYRSVGAQNSATNFLWEFYVYFDATTAANVWSAEYDLYQAIGGFEFMIGSQCNFGDGHWDTWNQAIGAWVHTAVPCPRFTPGTWHRIQWYMQRVSSTQYRYDTLVVDGQVYTVNQTFSGSSVGWADTLGVQWQLDLGSNGLPANEWIDQVKLTVW